MTDGRQVLATSQNVPASSSSLSRGKYWCWTLNNYTQLEKANIDSIVDRGSAAYVIYGIETSASGTPHLQGYIEFTIRKSHVAAKSAISRRAHVEPRRGTQTQAIEYTMKDGMYYEFGIRTITAQGRRSDLDEIAQLLRGGTSIREIASQFPSQFVRYHQGIRALARELLPRHVEVRFGPFPWQYPETINAVVLWGESGIGKTEFAKFLLPKALFISHIDQLTLYDPEEYTGVIFDDMSFKHLPRETQIHVLDWDNDRAIHVRNVTAFIPKHTPKIFTSNQWTIFTENDRAIDRRVVFLHLQ